MWKIMHLLLSFSALKTFVFLKNITYYADLRKESSFIKGKKKPKT